MSQNSLTALVSRGIKEEAGIIASMMKFALNGEASEGALEALGESTEFGQHMKRFRDLRHLAWDFADEDEGAREILRSIPLLPQSGFNMLGLLDLMEGIVSGGVLSPTK